MAKRNALKDVDPVAITICKQGANRQRIFLRKSVAEAELLSLPHEATRILKAADGEGGWSTFYCVVAEPGAEEDPGQTGERDSVDVWADADEIRKAAHRLMKNKGYVNLVHDGLAEEGLTIVENAVALADFDIAAPDGTLQTIKKDSWYVAIECNEDAVAAVEAGDIEGISLEGTGIRVPLEKEALAASVEARIRKALSFSEVVGGRELQDNLWRAWSTLESVIFDIFRDDDVTDPKPLVRTALAEFEAYLLGKLEALPDDAPEGLAKILGTFDNSTDEEGMDMGLTEDFAALKKTVTDGQEATEARLAKSEEVSTQLVGLVGGMVERIEALAAKGAAGKPEDVKKDGEGTLESVIEQLGKLADTQDEQDANLTAIAKSIRALSAGDTSQGAETEVRKTNSEDPLAGLLA